MAIVYGTTFAYTGTTLPDGEAATGTVISGSDVAQSASSVEMDGGTYFGALLNAGQNETFIVDQDGDGDYSDEAATTVTDIDRYTATVTYADGTTATLPGELAVVTLDDGTQYLLFRDSATDALNAAGSAISSFELTEFQSRWSDRTIDNGVVHLNNYGNTVTNTTVVCFCAGTKIATADGLKNVETLKSGDMLMTASGDISPLKWVGRTEVTPEAMKENTKLQPVRFSQGSLGYNIPSCDVWVSRQHRVHLSSTVATNMFGDGGALIAAKYLLGLNGIKQICPESSITYIHLYLDQHSLLISENMVSESFLIGEQSISALSNESKVSLNEVAPQYVSGNETMKPACEITSGKAARQLIWRHIKNHKSFQDTSEIRADHYGKCCQTNSECPKHSGQLTAYEMRRIGQWAIP